MKICGLRDAGTIRAMDGLAVDEVGFVFAKSRRQVEPETAASLIAEVKRLRSPQGDAPKTVGVFVGASLEGLRELLAVAPLDVVQLHGDEDPELCSSVRDELGKEVWKVFSVSGEDAAGTGHERLFPFQGTIDAALIDTAGGGTGQTFGWEAIPRYAAAAKAIGVPLYVAGGLHPDNASELLGNNEVDGVDVSSGVETDGVKDIEKIRAFVERVKAR
ncbi:phosphoribosylanthranilate isomerase [Paenibacillus methanolicus]|uniref:N-(5'-phosphoribosyl)anthranilate isomerase n=1 Tax=Paenibacillus methanolicus TaxID=582686 RepID=A0A5S5CGX3_9BACL|nr:phosphoribosylanthranilate isomerase [Paenibacillus methanolicus]